MATDDCYAKLV